MDDSLKTRADNNILGTYKRFPVTFTQGQGNHLLDTNNKTYLDLGGGIAVNSLGHSHPEIVSTIAEQASKLSHISNLYWNIPQIELAEKINESLDNKGRVFFCNSGAEANECLLKLARKFGSQTKRHKIVTALQSFHGRTFGGMSATGQDKIKKGFEPLLQGFTHVPFNDFDALKNACDEQTCAILIEGIQGESGIVPAPAEYLKNIRELCDRNNMLFMMDGVQCGFFRTGSFQSYQAIVQDPKITAPDAIAMAKSMGAGFPIGAAWINEKHSTVLDYGSHGSTYGGNPLACAVSLKTFEIIKRDDLAKNVTELGEYLISGLQKLKNDFPDKIKQIRGLGFIIGVEFSEINRPAEFKDLTTAAYLTLSCLDNGLLVVPAGTNVIRLLPALNTKKPDLDEGLEKLSQTLSNLK